MYHHRRQPHTSHLANRNRNAFGSLNHQQNNQSVNASAVASPKLNNNQGPEVGQLKSSYNSDSTQSVSHQTRYQSNNNFGNQNRSGTNAAYHSGAYSSQPKQFAEERQDVIFRRVRGILNKITPETFDKLSQELINVGLDSPRTLRGLIYLLFDKALKDLKYSSLYAKLCQQLSEKAPNFETEPGPNTFCKFLISKCEDEFERRRKATEDFDGKNELTDEEFEQKTIAKQKMLGNIKFICELGKKRLLQEEILYECIRGLLSKKKERPIQEQAQDLECLCQIMRTIGSLLDIEASRNLMNQYFERVDMYSRKPELPSRIRFMLKDVIDLRNNKWRPRPFQKEDNVPQPLSRLREESGYNPPAAVSLDKLGNTKNLLHISDLSKLHGNRLSSLLLDDDGPSFTTTTDFHWGSNTFMPDETEFDIFSTAAPIQKIDTSQRNSNATSAVRMKSILSAKSTYTASVSKHPFTNPFSSISQQSTQNRSPGKFNNNNGLMNANRSDSAKDPYRRVRFNLNERLPHSEGNTMGPHGNQIISKHPSRAGQDLNRTNDVEELQMTGPPTKASFRSSDITSIPMGQEGDVQSSLNNNFLHNNNRSTARGSSPSEPTLDPRMGASKSAHSIRDEHLERSTSTDRHNDIEMLDNDRSRPSLELSDRRHEQHVQGLGSGPRERRNERFEREPRQPKFSGANYRLPGRDRPLQNQSSREQFLAVRKDQMPESEINLNWRAKPSIEQNASGKELNFAKESIGPVDKLNDLSQSDARSRERPPAGLITLDTIRRGHNQRNLASHEAFHDERNESNRFKKPQQSINSNEESFQDSRGSISITEKIQPKIANPQNQPRFDEIRSTEPSIKARPYGDPGPLELNRTPNRFNVQEPEHHNRDGLNQTRAAALPPRLNQNSGERRDRDRHRQNIGGQLPASERRPREDPRQMQNRNPHAEFNRSPDRVKDWRKEVTTNASKRDQPPVASLALPSSLLPKAPTRMSETDFSLRPSHNLVGRNVTDFSMHHVSKLTDAKSILNSSELGFETRKLQESTNIQKTVSGANLDQNKNSSEPKPKDEAKMYVDMFNSLMKQIRSGNSSDITKIATKVKELKVPKSFHHECLLSMMKQSVIGIGLEGQTTSKFLISLVPSIFETAALSSAFKTIFEQMQALEAETPKVKSLVAEFLSRSVVDDLLALDEVAALLSGGKHHPLFLLLLQKLEKSCGQAWLSGKFAASKVNLMDMLPEVDRSKERLATALKDRCLGFLDPILTIEPDLWLQMRDNDPSPAAIYRWIKDNVDQTILISPTFAHVFVACLLKYVHSETSQKFKMSSNQSDSDDSNKSSPSNSVSQAMNEFEKELLSKYQQVLQALLKNKPMQLATLYAVQSFYHELDFPKGALLRWFHNLYDMSVVDDDIFFIWKEEINNDFPGKGQALFQVNTWLNWLAEAESEEEEDA